MAGRSGNPAKRAEQLRISQIGDFKKRMGGVMELPSGVVVKLRNPGGMQAFLGGGAIPNSLMPIVQKALKTGQNIDVSDVLQDGKFDEEVLSDMMAMMDNIALKTVVEPPVEAAPTQADVTAWNDSHPGEEVLKPEDLRSDDVLYIDEFPLEDKQYIMQWVSGGVTDLESFRKQLSASVAGVDSVARAQGIPELHSGTDAG